VQNLHKNCQLATQLIWALETSVIKVETGNLEYLQTAGIIIGYIVSIPISIWCMKEVLQKNLKVSQYRF
jgi:hypothetical protein